MQEILYSDDRIWHDSTLTAFDPRRLVWIEKDKQLELRAFLSGKPPRPTETVKVSYPSPQRVELEANLESAGIVVLADIHYPGWKLTIDGQPAPIYKVNRLMRGAAVPDWRPPPGLQLRTTLVPGWRNDHARRPGGSRGLCRLLRVPAAPVRSLPGRRSPAAKRQSESV